jgi:heterogeneous nuclear rnp K-like protein 2
MKTAPKKMPGINKIDNVPKAQHPPPKSSPLSSPQFLPSSPTRNLFKTIVTITVGPNRQPFYVHLESLCAISPFFAAAFNKTYNFAESGSATLNLPEARPEDFKYFVQWLYTHTLNHEELVGGHPAFFRLLRLYILADTIGVTRLKNDIVDAIAALADSSNSVPTAEDTRTIYSEISETSLLRKLVLDLFLWKRTEGLIETHLDSWYIEFLPYFGGSSLVGPWRLTSLSVGAGTNAS